MKEKKKDLDFEQKLQKAKDILEQLMQPDIKLNKSLSLYKEGKKELLEASKMLENAKIEIKELNSEEIS